MRLLRSVWGFIFLKMWKHREIVMHILKELTVIMNKEKIEVLIWA